jgi:hypothetical protein
MRSDMAKVIVERPRFGSRLRDKDRKGRNRAIQRLGLDGLKRERIGSTDKGFNEHLGPLRRFLNSQVGRLWDNVHAEIRKHIRCDSVVQKHVLTHVDQYVEKNVLIVDGVPCHGEGFQIGSPIRFGWYVCPRSGLLRCARQGSNERIGARDNRRERRRLGVFRVGKTQLCKVVDGRWCLVEVRDLPGLSNPHAVWAKSTITGQDVVLKRPACDVTERQALAEYGARVFAVAYRPLSKREMPGLPVPIDLWKQRRWWTNPGCAR